jgi:hypothetical protein
MYQKESLMEISKPVGRISVTILVVWMLSACDAKPSAPAITPNDGANTISDAPLTTPPDSAEQVASNAVVLANWAAEQEEEARKLDGKLIISGAVFYRIHHVHSLNMDASVMRVDVDPLFLGKFAPAPNGNDDMRRSYYNVALNPEHPCGQTNSNTSLELNTSHLRIEHDVDYPHADDIGNNIEFITLREYLRGFYSEKEGPINRITPDIYQHLQNCAKQVAQAADAMKFSAIVLYTRDGNSLAAIRRTTKAVWSYEEGPGDNAIRNLGRIEITPAYSDIKDFTVDVRAVSVMHCDYEGPHIELDGWKRGLSEPVVLKREGNQFLVDMSVLQKDAPAFPAYTQDELRSAIGNHFGSGHVASPAEATPCAPFLRGYIFTVRHAGKVVQELHLSYAGGC